MNRNRSQLGNPLRHCHFKKKEFQKDFKNTYMMLLSKNCTNNKSLLKLFKRQMRGTKVNMRNTMK